MQVLGRINEVRLRHELTNNNGNGKKIGTNENTRLANAKNPVDMLKIRKEAHEINHLATEV